MTTTAHSNSKACEQGPPLPSTIQVPWSSQPENLYHNHTWRQPGTDRVLRLAFSTPFLNDSQGGVRSYMTWYQVSTDGGQTYGPLKQVIQQGDGYDALHPIRPVWVGKNMYVPSIAPPSLASHGEVMVPFYFWTLDESGERLYEGRFSYLSYTEAGVLIGRWNADATDLTWDLGQTVRLDFESQSTRGAMEPAIIELDRPGRFLMVLRGSNLHRPQLPSHKWTCLSTDHCHSWSEPTPFAYADGEPFFSPSSCSVICRHEGNGKIYWFGNICPHNAQSNAPRYPLVMAVVAPDGRGLVRQTVRVIVDRDPARDSPHVQFSNFQVEQDASTGDFVVTLRRIDMPPGDEKVFRETRWPVMRLNVTPP